MQVQYFATDVTDADYYQFLRVMVSTHGSFSLVWRDQLAHDQRAASIRADLKRDEIDYRYVDRWPGTRLFSGAGKATVVSYHCSETAFPVLLRPGSLFSWRAPSYPEDLCFYDLAGRCSLASVSHEREAYVLGEPALSALAGLVDLTAEAVREDVAHVLRGT